MTGCTKARGKKRTQFWTTASALTMAALVAVLQIDALGQAPAGGLLGRALPQSGASQPGGSSGKRGSLSGKLTDLHSAPLDGATVVLRNTATGAEVRTVTQRNGSYRFTSLAAGEYTLVAESESLGQGSLDGIFVSAGAEAHVQAAMEFAIAAAPPAEPRAGLAVLASRRIGIVPPLESASISLEVRAESLSYFAPPNRQFAGAVRQSPQLDSAVVLSLLPTEGPLPFDWFASLFTRPTANPHPAVVNAAAQPGEAVSAPALRAIVVGNPVRRDWALDVAKGIALCNESAQLALAHASLRSLLAMHQNVDPVSPVVAVTLTAEEVQSLPAAGRRWQSFLPDTPGASSQSVGEATPAQGGTRAASAETVIDGASTRLAFGSVTTGGQNGGDRAEAPGMGQPWASGRGAQVAEAAIREVESAAGSAEGQAARASGGQISVTTQQGGQGFHGQGFFFDRQNSWGARNPFTTWVQQTTPAMSGTVPGYTAEPYTPPDDELVWGLGAGSEWKRRKLFWFGAVDSYRRNDAAVATVKHPYLLETLSGCTLGPCTEMTGFFAQPANNQMQVLAARLGLSAVNPVTEGLAAYSSLLETLAGLLGPAPRTASQWVGFARADWQAAERHRITLEAIGGKWSSPGGGLTRVSEAYGNHSFGNGVASEELLMGRWEAFATSNLLAVTQASTARNILSTHAETPSAFEQTLLGPNVWGQLPEMVVDSRYGFTIGNPSRFGRGSYPDEKQQSVKQSVDWVRGSLLLKAGFELAHDADATTLLRNQTGTYHYSTVENFVSDALVFQKFGLGGELNPADQHNCDQTGRVWSDSGGNLRGLGYLPCYSWYSQMMGPSGWRLSTNDWASFATAQWTLARRTVFSAGLRWEREQLPGPIAALNNPNLPLTQHLPALGNNWGPRVSMAIGSGESYWPVLRLGYGMYFSSTPNQVIETALTQTGSLNGDLSFFLRPTDNLNQGGAPPFPYVLQGAPGNVVKPGAVEFAPRFHNPEIHQAVAALEEHLPGHMQLTASALLSLGRRLPSSVDANFDPAVNPGTITYSVVDETGAGPIKTPQITVPFYASWPSTISPTGFGGRLNAAYQQVSEIMSRANSTYEAGMVKLERYGRRGLSLHAHYTYGHAMDWNPDESSQIEGSSVFDPADFRQEYGTGNLDVRHSAAIIATYAAPWKLHGTAGKLANGWMLSAIGDFRSGLPYTMRTGGSLSEEFVATTGAAIAALGPGMNGSGGDNRVYGVGRNTYRYPATWKADLRLGRRIDFGRLKQLELMAETFNLFNHQNVTELETTGYFIEPGNLSGGLPTLNFLNGLKANTTAFGQPLNVNATDFFRERQIQLGMRMRF